MPKITADGAHLTVLNLFSTDAAEKQESLLGAMREIVDSAAYPGWISSTVHSGTDRFGTANFIQWRSTEDLEKRYAGEEFKHRTLPLFSEMTTAIRLLQNEVVYTLQAPELGGVTEISPTRDDYTVIEVLKVADGDQDALVEALGPAQEWLLKVPGFRTHTVLRGLRARGLEGAFVVCYDQWADKASYDAFRTTPQAEQPADRLLSQSRVDALVIERDSNTYRVVHTRTAAG
ncbi:antibiotic biosynthesis monooxygenase family protein [Streptomyces sp. B1866]|uniref:antibiotic biosynthesis monooxygenase family protein n=1 Tax=Streptomyces sp. B1866 TaxID=3075431 RepID=UPI00288F1717|nr:antibiotic biosynthesis monooxygenase family protein [Streptomyces sp. B1866]MDT3397072.1 antibiotic biosynthesis monooxygenase family protein [Streptomyces sp. B1866]